MFQCDQPSAPSRRAIVKTICLRDKVHCKYVATQACLICGRMPSQAHHIRFAQPRSLGRKVSGEYTVPVCRLHHRELHRYGDEASWWAGAGSIRWPLPSNCGSDRDHAMPEQRSAMHCAIILDRAQSGFTAFFCLQPSTLGRIGSRLLGLAPREQRGGRFFMTSASTTRFFRD
jgi:hypothetical protein